MTPVLAVINELAQQEADLEVRFVCDKAFESQSRGLMAHALVPVSVSTVMAGKLRRYHGESLSQRLLDFSTIMLNLRDIFYIIGGFFQSLWLVARYRPDVVFAKGGYVCLPVGLAARLLGRKLVIHDSDTRAGLTNKLLARFADAIATGSPLDNYNYPKHKSTFTGVPIDKAFHPFSEAEKRQAKHSIGVVDLNRPLVVVTGGGLGAKSINEAMVKAGRRLIDHGAQIYHIAGKKHYQTVDQHAPEHPHYQVVPFVYKDMANVLGAADVVVARASATFIQELAGLEKPVIIVPAAHLGDQVKNARVYKEADAAVILSDSQISQTDILGTEIIRLIDSPEERKRLASKLHEFAKPQAARQLAEIISKLERG